MVWQCSQTFGESNKAKEADRDDNDVISAVSFNATGQYLAAGDVGGRVILFESIQDDGTEDPQCNSTSEEKPMYRYLTEFQSHEPEFDYLKSMEIEERVNQIKWLRPSSNSISMLSTNDKRIKLWKVHERSVKNVSNFNLKDGTKSRKLTSGEEYAALQQGRHDGHGINGTMERSSTGLKVPRIKCSQKLWTAKCRKNFANGHLYHIHSIDVNSDGETFISADDLHINLWNLEVHDTSFNIVDMQPDNMEELTEVITSALFHPKHCHIMAHSSSKGTIRLSDMRSAALCDTSAKVFEMPKTQGNHSFFSEIVANITDIKFSGDGDYILSRDYLTVKLWDVRMEEKPVSIFNVQDALTPKLVELYENDCIFDKFECSMSSDGKFIASGSYSSCLKVFGVYDDSDELIEASLTPTNVRAAAEPTSSPKSPRFVNLFRTAAPETSSKRAELDVSQLNYDFKVKQLQWHPKKTMIAVPVLSKIYMLYNSGVGERNQHPFSK